MPFFINEDQRISINLSDFANYIIETDMVTFGKDKRSTFINIVIKNFKDEAKSTITTSSFVSSTRWQISLPFSFIIVFLFFCITNKPRLCTEQIFFFSCQV